MPLTATTTYNEARVDPVYDSKGALCHGVNLPDSVSYVAGTILGEITATPGLFSAYAPAATNGTEVAKAILQYDCTVDADGNISLGTSDGAPFGQTSTQAPAYFSGTFRTAELKQSGAGALDAAAVADLGHLINGTVADGILRIG